MSRNLIRFSIPLISGAAVALVVLGCSSSSSTGTPASDAGAGGSTGTGGTTGGGGSSAGGKTGTGGGSTGGGTGTGGGTTVTDAGSDYVCFDAPPIDQGGTGADGADCCDTGSLGKVGKCVVPSTITDPIQKAAFGHDSCSPTLLCAPNPTLQSSPPADAGVYDVCHAKGLVVGGGAGLEGRCLPKCFVLGNPQAPNLQQDDCKSAAEVCAPCYSPLAVDGKTGAQLTGACSQKAGDAPTEPPPAVYKTCGTLDGGVTKGLSGGTCVPKALALASGNPAAPSLKQDDCDTAEELCVPTLKANNIHACFSKCTTTLGGVYGPGACTPSYVVLDVAGQAGLGLLSQGTCTGDDLCAPCLDPLHGGVPSHACE